MGSRWGWVAGAGLLGVVCAVPLRPYHQAFVTAQPPERILVLGVMWTGSGPAFSWRVGSICRLW